MKRVKNVIELVHQPTNTDIAVCYGEQNYIKYMKKRYSCDEIIEKDGATTIVTNSRMGMFSIVIGLKEFDNIYSLKGLMVHELSHTVTQIMEEFGFKCDEFRSYTLQWLYQEVTPFIDKKFAKK